MVSFSLILEKIKIFSFLFGGSVSLGKFVPLIFLSYDCGCKTGVFASFVCGMIHFIFSFKVPPVKSFFSFLVLILLDYILPYVVVGMASFFDFSLKSKRHKIIYTGVGVSFILKIFISTVAGVVLWSEYVPLGKNIWIYSFIYNAGYQIPECLICFFMIAKLKKYFNIHNFETLSVK